MPSLFRFLIVLAVLAGLVYGGLVALTILVEPDQREMTVKIPAKRLNPQ
ncbi:MAG: histidine kinase [Pseudomonadota bacterium]